MILYFVLIKKYKHYYIDKTDNHSQRIQELIRENFELFSRCADGVDLFKTEPTGRSKNSPSVNEWLDKIDSLTKTTSDNAKASFKPLLDNTNEVRKVQSALRVLQRVGPLLQVPSLMRQHIENGRFNAAVSTYRRVLVIDDDCNIKLLHHAKQKAVEAANDARIDLESHLASPNLPIHVSFSLILCHFIVLFNSLCLLSFDLLQITDNDRIYKKFNRTN